MIVFWILAAALATTCAAVLVRPMLAGTAATGAR